MKCWQIVTWRTNHDQDFVIDTIIKYKIVPVGNNIIIFLHIVAFGFCDYGDPEASLRAIRLLHTKALGDKALVVSKLVFIILSVLPVHVFWFSHSVLSLCKLPWSNWWHWNRENWINVLQWNSWYARQLLLQESLSCISHLLLHWCCYDANCT